MEGAPYAFNAGGVKAVQTRAKEKTNAAALAAAGGGNLFPLYYMDLADNGNFLETNEIAKRATPCGDPRLVRRWQGGGSVALGLSFSLSPTADGLGCRS